jgi:hypothetical protein
MLVRKLTHKLRDAELARALVAAGLDTPRKIKAASDEELEAAAGKSGLAAVRKRIVKVK